MLLDSLIIGLLRAADGNDKLPKAAALVLTGVLIALAYINIVPLYILPLIIGLTYLGFAPGWGKYLTATGLGSYNPSEKESPIVDFLIQKLDAKYAPVVGMSLRWFIYFIPLFAVLLNPFVFGLLLIGPMYYLHRFHKSWFITEFSTGTLFGLLVLLPTLFS